MDRRPVEVFLMKPEITDMKSPGEFLKFDVFGSSGALRPDPVFIIGMHRSGTSALGGALEALAMPPDAEGGNPKGFYENLALMQFHDRFLKFIHSEWQHPEPVGRKRFRGFKACLFRRELLKLLKDEFGQDRPLIKDPRMCRLMPLWIPLIRKHFPRASFILPVRHPVEVASSLRKRDGFTLDHGLKLWVVHVLESERTTRGLSRQFTTYNQLMRSPIETVRQLANNLGLPTDAIAAAVARQIDTKLRHHSELPWPAGQPHEELTLSIHQTLASGAAPNQEMLDRLRQEYYSRMGWDC
jgi:hypothetical protein